MTLSTLSRTTQVSRYKKKHSPRIDQLTEKGNCLPVQCPPVSAARVHLRPYHQQVAQEIPSRVCHHSAVEIHPRWDEAALEQHAAVATVWSAQLVMMFHKAQQTICQPITMRLLKVIITITSPSQSHLEEPHHPPPSWQRTDSPAVCASCAMTTADESNHSAASILYPHHTHEHTKTVYTALA